MDESSSEFRAAFAELVEATHRPPGDHPSADGWLAYHRGELAAAEEERLQEHLVRCRDCFDLAQAAETFAGTPEDSEEPDAGDETSSAALWRLLRPRLAPVREVPRSPRRFRLPETLAASFFVALVALSAWSVHQQRELAELRAPRPDAPIVDLFAGDRLSLSSPAETRLAAGTGPWMLVFHPSDDRPLYRLAVRDAATGRELSSHELRPDADHVLTLALPAGLPPGRYRLLLSGAGGAGSVPEEHLLRVTEAGRGD